MGVVGGKRVAGLGGLGEWVSGGRLTAGGGEVAGRACPAPTGWRESLCPRGAREGGSPPPFPLTGCRGRLRAAYMPPLQSGRKSTQLNFIKFTLAKPNF